MNPEEYKRVGEVYHAALERPTNERKGFLDGACGGDAELRIYEGVLHGFLHWSRLVPTAAQALDDGACALKKSLFKPLP